MKYLLKSARMLGCVLVVIPVTSCGLVGDSWMSDGMTAAAKNQIMLVRKEPPSFGYQRLELQSSVYPDLGFFVTKHGQPDFLAETGERKRQYFILYYLRDREAFACRTRPENGQGVEFAGPYPITEREFRLLDGFKRDPSKKPTGF